MDVKNLVTIGKLAKQAQVGVQTLHYYERRSLLKPRLRKTSGYRLYDNEAVKTVRFIKHAQELGFTLNEIEGLLKLRAKTKSQCSKVVSKAQSKLVLVDEKISALQKIKRSLDDLILECHSNTSDSECPILKHFDDEEFHL